MRGGFQREQVPEHPYAGQGPGRAGHTVQLSEDCHHQSGHRLQAMGDRTAVLPDDYDEDRPHQASRVHRLPEEVRHFNIFSPEPFPKLKINTFNKILFEISIQCKIYIF